jgi:glyoxylase-like metal-dependent hydrolase (beta-lactamase superfamily II)
MRIIQIVVGPLATNCYLVREDGAAGALLIDPGAEPEAILQAVEGEATPVTGIVCTHGHPDHTGALRKVVAATGAPVYIHSADAPLLRRTWPEFFVTEAPVGPGTELRELRDGDLLKVTLAGQAGQTELRVLHTPGHSPGGVVLTGAEVAFTGDTLFAGGVGRTDLPGGDPAALAASLKRLMLELSPITLIYPGHGASTLLTQELASNPWLK